METCAGGTWSTSVLGLTYRRHMKIYQQGLPLLITNGHNWKTNYRKKQFRKVFTMFLNTMLHTMCTMTEKMLSAGFHFSCTISRFAFQ